MADMDDLDELLDRPVPKSQPDPSDADLPLDAAGGDIDDDLSDPGDDDPGPGDDDGRPDDDEDGSRAPPSDDDAPWLARAEKRRKDHTEATERRKQYQDLKSKLDAEMAEALAEERKVRQSLKDGDASDDDELAARQRTWDVSRKLHDAENALGQIDRYMENLNAQDSLPAAQQAWLDRTPEYHTDSSFAGEAQRIAAKLTAEGMDPGHAQFYRKLDKELRRPKKMARGKKVSGAPVRGSSGRRTSADASRRVSADRQPKRGEAYAMTQFGLDPKNKRHLAEWNGKLNKLNNMLRERRGL